MKVCVFTQQFGNRWSGVGTYATNLVAGLLKKGIEVVVVCPTGMHSDLAGVKILEVAMKGWESKVNYWLPLAWRFSIVLKMMAQRERFDVAHFSDAREALFAPRNLMALVGTVNDYYSVACPLNPLALKPYYEEWFSRWVYWRAVRLLEPFAYRKLDGIAANSEYIRNVLADAYRLDAQRVEVVNYGIEEASVGDPINLDGDPSILFVGANFQRKGLPQLLKALVDVRRSLPGVILHVVGEDPRRKAMESLGADMGLSSNVRFLGGRPNEEVRRMKPDMFVMPSLIEGFGIVFLEAMLARIPVIGGKTGGTIELIRDGENGFAVAPADTEDLSRKISRLARDEGLREQFVREGLATASKFTVDRMAENTIALYNRAIERK